MRELPPRLPLAPPSRVHLDELTTEIGVTQHAIGSRPDPTHGYCVDDVARAMQVDLLHARELGWGAVSDSLRRGMRFLQAAAEGRGTGLRNFRRADGSWIAGPGSEDSQARALLAVGETVALGPPGSIVEHALELWARLLPMAGRLTALRAQAGVILACSAVLDSPVDGLARATIEELATGLDSRMRDVRSGWPWPEPVLTYENALLPRALIVAGSMLDRRPLVVTGLAALDWLVAIQTAPAGHLSPIGNGWWPMEGNRSQFDQQPIEASALLLAAEAALRATGDSKHRQTMEMAYDWFLGRNDTGRRLADPERGSCCDGLTAHGVNTNEGAESTLMWLISAEHIRTLRGPSAARPMPATSIAKGIGTATAARPFAPSMS